MLGQGWSWDEVQGSSRAASMCPLSGRVVCVCFVPMHHSWVCAPAELHMNDGVCSLLSCTLHLARVAQGSHQRGPSLYSHQRGPFTAFAYPWHPEAPSVQASPHRVDYTYKHPSPRCRPPLTGAACMQCWQYRITTLLWNSRWPEAWLVICYDMPSHDTP